MEPKGGRVLLLCLMVIFWTIDVICEAQREETRLVFGAEGGNVTLQLNRNDVEDVSWVYDGDHVRVKTKPGKPIEIRDPNHKGNMRATEDGSLVIMNLGLEDQKVYNADLLLKEKQESNVTLIHYDLKVYKILSAEDIQLEGNITNTEPCRVLMTCVVKEPNVTVTWSNGSGLIFTGNVLNIEDVHSNLNITCTAKNPISNITKAVKPSQFCRGKTEGNESNKHLGVTVGILSAVVVVVGAVSFFVYLKVSQR
ncbi:SLAM family member 9-like [Lithobates pipiens]